MMNAVGITCMMHTAKSTAMLRSSVLKTAMMVGLNIICSAKNGDLYSLLYQPIVAPLIRRLYAMYMHAIAA